VSGIQTALAVRDLADLPPIPTTGEQELDRIVTALNDAGRRLGESRFRAEQLARQVATAERLAAIGRVAAGVAHEIRNPIAGMRLKAENALAKGSERYGDALLVILSQIERLDRLLSRLLNITEPEHPRVEKVDVASLLDRCLGTVRELAQARGLRLESYTNVETALVDPELVLRAVNNLLLNAIQAAPERSMIRLTAAKENDQLVFSVLDEGAGPPPHVRSHLFEPFVTGRADGTGLGLSIVREVAESHGGTVSCKTCASGTTFEIILPCQAF
jgi:signal transduction histidine kinase